MDLNAYHNAWMQGYKESECVRIGEEAYFDNQHLASQEAAHYAEEERKHYTELERQYIKDMEELYGKNSSDNVEDWRPSPWCS